MNLPLVVEPLFPEHLHSDRISEKPFLPQTLHLYIPQSSLGRNVYPVSFERFTISHKNFLLDCGIKLVISLQYCTNMLFMLYGAVVLPPGRIDMKNEERNEFVLLVEIRP